MTAMKDFALSTPRPLPVILLLDVSGSMAQAGKIEALNGAVAGMISAFAQDDGAQAVIHVAIITFGQEGAQLHQALQPADQVKWVPMQAQGKTPLGGAFTRATELIEDRGQVPSRAYAPTIVLVSDGAPTDDWKGPLQALLNSPRASKAERIAMAIGGEARLDTLQAFLADNGHRVFQAHEVDIQKFFRRVTMSVSARSRSVNPNQVAAPTEDDYDF